MEGRPRATFPFSHARTTTIDSIQWETLPAAVRSAVEETTGTIIKAEPAAQGTETRVTAVLDEEGGRQFFLKAAREDDPSYPLLERERFAHTVMTMSTPAPALVTARYAAGWIALAFESLAGARHPDLSPGSGDIPRVLAMLSMLGVSPAWEGTPGIAERVSALRSAALPARSLPCASRAVFVTALDRFDDSALAGGLVVHGGLAPGRLAVTGGETVLATGWAWMSAGVPWIDSALLVPHLIAAGHDPSGAESAVSAVPAWKAAPVDAVTGLAALWTLHQEHEALHGPAGSRERRAREAGAGRAWVEYRAA